MFEVDASRIYSNVIIDPYSLKDLRLIVISARQEFVTAVINLRTLQLAAQDAWSQATIWHWRKIRRIEKALQAIRATIREKRAFLDDIERALEIAETYNYEEMEKRGFYLKSLEETEDNDDVRYEQRLEELDKRIDGLSGNALLAGIRKQLAEVFFAIEKMDHQSKRRRKWDLYGPPRSVREEFEKIYAESAK
jgi:DNA polymerase I-like protein with 3'-5' exonuclease and polymerase domains